MAVGRQPDEGQRPQGSEREAVRILKRQNLQQSFSPQATFFESALFNYREPDCKHCGKATRSQKGEAVKPAHAIGATATTWPIEMTTHESKVTARTGTIQSRCANSKPREKLW